MIDPPKTLLPGGYFSRLSRPVTRRRSLRPARIGHPPAVLVLIDPAVECAETSPRSSIKDQRRWSSERKVESCGCAAARRGSRPGVPRTTPATTTATDEPLSPWWGSLSSPCPLLLHLERRHVFTPTHTPVLVACWGVRLLGSRDRAEQVGPRPGDPTGHAACRRDGRQQHVPSSRPSCHDQVPSEDRTDGRPGSAGRPRCAEPGPRLCARAVRVGDGQCEPGRPGLGDRTSHRRPARRAAARRTP